MRGNNFDNCDRGEGGFPPAFDNMEGCHARRYLEPILVAKIYNQPIVEEIPYSTMQMTVDNIATISDVHSRPLCNEMQPRPLRNNDCD